MEHKYFSENEYHTPQKASRSIWDRLSLGSSLYFNFKFLSIVFKNRKLAVENNYDTQAWAQSSYEILKFIERCKGKFHITGLQNLQLVKDEPVVFISNHMSTLETMVLPGIIAPVKEVTFVVKKPLITNKIFGPIMRSRNPIAVGREESRQDLITVLQEGQEKLKNGSSIVIFPQSTRTNQFDPNLFNSLGTKLAAKAGVKIVPIALKTDFWENGKAIKDLGHLNRSLPIYFEIGLPMAVSGNGKKEHTKVVQFISDRLEKWKSTTT